MIIVGPGGRKMTVKGSPIDGASTGDLRSIMPTAGRMTMLTRELTAYTYEQMYARQLWVNVCVNKLSRGIARLPLPVFEWKNRDTGDRERIRDHPLVELLENPWPGASSWDLKEFLVGSNATHGNALLVKSRRTPSSPPEELWPVPWRHIETKLGPNGRPALFIFHGSRDRIEIQPREVVHLTWARGGGALGISPLEPLKQTLKIDIAAMEWAAQNFLNGATPSGVFTSKDKLDQRTIPRLRAELEMLYGGIENAGRFGIFDQGLAWQPLAHSAVDTALIEQRKLNREETAGAFEISPPLIGILDRATFNNVTELHRMLYQDTLGPHLTNIEATFGVQLIKDEPTFDGLWAEFDLNEVLRGDLPARADALTKMVAGGVLTPNEARHKENLPSIADPAADTIYMPLNLAPVGASTADLEARAAAFALLGPAAQEPSRATERDGEPMMLPTGGST